LDNFIREYFIRDPEICDGVVDALEKLKAAGHGRPGVSYMPDAPDDFDFKSVKDSWDLVPPDFAKMYPNGPKELRLDEIADEMNNELFPRYYKDIELHFRGELFSIRPPQFQMYEPGGGYKVWHCDAQGVMIHRVFVYILYLNDLSDGGTEFKHQNVRVKAEKGKVLMFPANFCYIHRSEVSHTSKKYIMTGWMDTDLVEMLTEESRKKPEQKYDPYTQLAKQQYNENKK